MCLTQIPDAIPAKPIKKYQKVSKSVLRFIVILGVGR